MFNISSPLLDVEAEKRVRGDCSVCAAILFQFFFGICFSSFIPIRSRIQNMMGNHSILSFASLCLFITKFGSILSSNFTALTHAVNSFSLQGLAIREGF